MNRWEKPKQQVIAIERELPKEQPNALSLECIYGPHKADLLHKGTAYCRSCYDRKNIVGELIN